MPRNEWGIEDPNDLFRLALAISRTNRVCALSSTNVALAIDQRSCFSATSTILKSISLVQECYRLSFFSNLTLVLKTYYQRQPTFVLKLTSLGIEEPRWALQGLQCVGQLWGLFDVSLEWILEPRRSLWPAPQKGHIRHPARPVRSRINFIQAPSKEKPRGWFVYGNSLEENAAIWRFTFYNEWSTSQPECRKGNAMVNQWETLSKKWVLWQ